MHHRILLPAALAVLYGCTLGSYGVDKIRAQFAGLFPERRGHDMTIDRAMVELALYDRAERLADHPNRCRCCDRIVRQTDGSLPLCANCQEVPRGPNPHHADPDRRTDGWRG